MEDDVGGGRWKGYGKPGEAVGAVGAEGLPTRDAMALYAAAA